MTRLADFLRRLFFTRDDDLDLLQVLFVLLVGITAAASYEVIVHVAAAPGTASGTAVAMVHEAFLTLRVMFTALIVAAVPSWMVPAITSVLTSRAFAAIGRSPGGDIYKDDESGGKDERREPV